MAHLALLWHLHQPDYRDPTTGRPVMPWVRLHALRGYRDLAVELVRDEVAATVNLVPSLLDQLLWYAGGGDDDHLALSAKPAAALTPSEQQAIRGTFVCGNQAMIQCQPAYRALAARVASDEALSEQDWRDLQVWSALAWVGATALADFPELGALQRQGSGFSEHDKARFLAIQRQIVEELPGQLAALAQSAASVSTTPYFHPILPLVVNNAHAQRCLDGVPDMGFAYPEDALLQLTRARARMHEVLGVWPAGCWPSEGSVSPEVVALIREAGFGWFATDEGVLRRSEGRRTGGEGSWMVDGIRGFFRDRQLSDAIGFDVARRDPNEAAAEILALAHKRAGAGVITVALDGENPWEAFEDAGAAFRAALHRGLRSGPVRAITLDDAVTLSPVGRIDRIATGSWINANFAIWYGHEDDRTAWRLLAEARAAAAADPVRGPAAIEALLPAQGSDWMWWYGDEFSTPFDGTFDALFRAHVSAAWRALGQEPPAELSWPIGRRSQSGPAHRAPRRLLDVGDYGPNSWTSWLGAGRIPLAGAAMARADQGPDVVHYGWDRAGDLWLRIALDPAERSGWSATLGEAATAAEDVFATDDGLALRVRPAAGGCDAPLRLHRAVDGRTASFPADAAIVLAVPSSAARALWFV